MLQLSPMSTREYFVYMMASRKGGAFYVGVTNNIEGRVWEHKTVLAPSMSPSTKFSCWCIMGPWMIYWRQLIGKNA